MDHFSHDCTCPECCYYKKHPQLRRAPAPSPQQKREQQGMEVRGGNRLLADLGASPSVHEGMPAGDFAGIDPTGKTPRMPADPLGQGVQQ